MAAPTPRPRFTSPTKVTRTGAALGTAALGTVGVGTVGVGTGAADGAASIAAGASHPHRASATTLARQLPLVTRSVVVAVLVKRNLHADTKVVHAGHEVDPATGALAPAIDLSTTFVRGEDGELLGDHLYGRYGNPTRDRLERCLAELEGAAAAMCVASGCAVAHTLVSTLTSGDTLAIGADMYFGIASLLEQMCARFGITLLRIDPRDDAALGAALAHKPKLLMCETPTNPLMQLVDVRSLAERCERAGTALVIDNTMATPLLQRPLDLGAHFVMHSTTKFLGGHSDIIGGTLLTRDAAHPTWQHALEVRKIGGAVPSPFDCWLLLRSIATLSVRLERQVDNAEQIATFLAGHPAIERVLYPGLPDHPGHALARRQMRRPGAMMSVLLAGGEDAAARFIAGLSLIVRATSLGGVHTLAEHRARVEPPTTTTPRHLIRLSIGIEHADDLCADLGAALDAL
jgi:cystathionine gamma-synthase